MITGVLQGRTEKGILFRAGNNRMTNLSKDICLRFKEARQAKGYNQSTLARLVECKQSAISMFEAGMTTKLSDETVKKIADILDVSLEEKVEVSQAAPPSQAQLSSAAVIHGYCPSCECPSNVPYIVGGHLFYRPMRHVSSPAGGPHCTQCGELLETRCPTCGAPLNDGACCASCGNAYVTPTLSEGTDLTTYVRIRNEEIERFISLFKT